MTVLVTGGAGYIGSHTIINLIEDNYDVVVIDNLSNSSLVALERIKEITGKTVNFHKVDLNDIESLEAVFEKYSFKSVIHFAGLKSVSDSVSNPLEYYRNNLSGSINVLSLMIKYNVWDFIFSSSATIYGSPDSVPVTEECKTGGTMNPYGTSKYMMELILQDISLAHPKLNAISLRYFNPVGAHPSGLIGESPKGTPNNLVPYITKVAIGKIDYLSVYGNDYPTPDGSGVRDYIHVQDLAAGHVAALKNIDKLNGYHTFNLGTGRPYSVLEVISCFEEVSQRTISFKVVKRRDGDIAECWSSSELANEVLGWSAKLTLKEMLADAWRWQLNNPDGY